MVSAAAFAAALALCLNASANTVSVSSFQRSTANGTTVFFDIILESTPSSSSTVVPAASARVASLFASAALGAAAKPSLVAALKLFGLPITNAFYGDQYPPPPPPPLGG